MSHRDRIYPMVVACTGLFFLVALLATLGPPPERASGGCEATCPCDVVLPGGKTVVAHEENTVPELGKVSRAGSVDVAVPQTDLSRPALPSCPSDCRDCSCHSGQALANLPSSLLCLAGVSHDTRPFESAEGAPIGSVWGIFHPPRAPIVQVETQSI